MIRPITSVKVAGRRVLLRAGFDVPLTDDLKVADDSRIKASLPTIKYLVQGGAKIIIVSHLNRPKGWGQKDSLRPVAQRLQELLGKTCQVDFFAKDITKEDYLDLSHKLADGQILFLENIRFYPGEEANDEEFVKLLASFGDIYVNDAFSVAHRKEASIFGVAKILPSYAGVDFLQEVSALSKITKNPVKPLVVMIAGIKIKDKEDAINNLARYASYILLGGGVANTFLKARGYEVGKSKINQINLAKALLRNHSDKLVLPVDVVVAKSPEADGRIVSVDKVAYNDQILDIGPETVRRFAGIIKTAKTLVWNGPFGLIEEKKFSHGSKSLALAFAARAKGPAFGIVGGGETVELIDRAKVRQFIDFVSTGGGAMLEFLAGKELPGVKALE